MVVGQFEVSLNINLDGERYWAGEIQLIASGSEREALVQAFSVEKKYRAKRPRQKMVEITEVGTMDRQFMYAQKRFFEQRVAYISKKTGRQDRNHLPLPENEWAEVDAWLLSLPLGTRAITYGCSRRGTTFFGRN